MNDRTGENASKPGTALPKHGGVCASITPMSDAPGLEVVFSAGGDAGEGLCRRIDFDNDPVASLRAAIDEAARQAGLSFPGKFKRLKANG